MINKLAAVLSLSFSSALFAPPPPSSVIAPIVRAMRDEGQKSARSQSGSVFVDVSSFTHRLRGLDERGVQKELNADEKGASRDSAVVCDTYRNHKRCSIAEDGLFISVQSISFDDNKLVATASVEWTEHRPSGSWAMGGHTLRLTFGQVDGKWVLTRREVLRES
jgi:hypothetical protein